MHTLHWFAVEAQDKDEAFDLVQVRLMPSDEGRFVEWSDWHVVGGGRWSKSTYEDSKDMVISYAESPDKFRETIEQCRKWRSEEMSRFLDSMDTDKFSSAITDYILNNGIPNNEQRFDMNSYYIKKAGDMLMDHYTSDSFFYDLKEYTAHMSYILERLDNDETKMLQFLVPVDFHF